MQTNNHAGDMLRVWSVYVCGTCGSVVTAWSTQHNAEAVEYFPESKSIDVEIPERPRAYLEQAHESLHAPAGAVMLAASAVDSMLKLRGYASSSLYSRIEMAAQDNVLTKDMAAWAHAVRLDANDQRHADEAATLPSVADARRVLEFATALGEFLFVLPSRIQRGIRGGKT